jgi:hypothetical protein
MILCLSCKHASPDGSLHCAHCALGLNARTCPNHHRVGLNARACTTCGSPVLSDATAAISFAWMSRLLSLLLVLLAWKWLILPNLGAILSGGLTGAAWGAAVLSNNSPLGVKMALAHAFQMVVMLWLLGHTLGMLPKRGGAVGQWLRSLPLFLARHGWRLLCRFARWLWPLLRHAVWSRAAPGHRPGGAEGKKG